MPAQDLQDRLASSAAAHGVPGAVLAVHAAGRVHEFACGLANVATGVAATPDTLFQVGSVTKVFTAALVTQLAEAGLVDLDAPIDKYLPNFPAPLSNSPPSLRHLLSHQSGLDEAMGDFADRGQESIANVVARIDEIGSIFPPGAHYSYSNTGYVVAGHILQVLTGRPWHCLIRERVWHPLGIDDAFVLPEHALRFRVAAGHIVDPATNAAQLAPYMFAPRSGAPAGSITGMTASGLLRFARLFFDRSDGPNSVLSRNAISMMVTPQADLSGQQGYAAWGLGLSLEDWGDTRVVGHDGGTIGFQSFFRMVPDRACAVALLTNGGDADRLYRDLVPEILQQICGIRAPQAPAGDGKAGMTPSQLVGTYRSNAYTLCVSEEEASLRGTFTSGLGGHPTGFALRPFAERVFAAEPPTLPFASQFTVLETDDDGRALFIRTNGGRAARRTEGQGSA